MNGHFSDESLTVYTTLVAERLSSNFSEQEFSYDFTRCVRPDGTAYGTGGKCRKGEEKPKELLLNRKTGGEFVGSSDSITGGLEKKKLEDQLKELEKQKKEHPEKSELADAQIKEISKKLNGFAANQRILDKFTANVPVGTTVSVEDGLLRSDITTKSGHVVTTYFGDKDFNFMVNGSYDTGTVTDRREQIEVAYTVRRTYEALVKSLPEGAVVTTAAWDQDGKGKDRVDAYARMGFSRPVRFKNGEFVEGEPGDTQYARKEGGRMVPSNRSEKDLDETYSFAEEALAIRLWHTAIFGRGDKTPGSTTTRPEKDSEYSEVLDYTRCQRANGTFYGTKGQCRKGSQAEAKTEEKLQGQFLGGGLEGKVYDIGRGRVLKVSASEGQREAQKLAAEAGLAPKVLATGAIKKDPSGRKYQIIEKVKAEEIPGIGQPGRPSVPLEELSRGDIHKERDAYLAALKLNSLGIAHGDIHGGNLQWDSERNRPILLDFDNAKVNKAESRGEAVSLLNNIGIRLEENGLYDEADSVYAVANGSSRNFYSRAARVIEESLG